MTDYPVTLLGLGAIMCAFFSGGIPGAICAISFLMYINMTSSRKSSSFTLCASRSDVPLLNIGCFFGAGLCGYLSLGLPGAICAIGIMLLIFDHNKVPVDNNRSSSNEHVYTFHNAYRYLPGYGSGTCSGRRLDWDNNTPQFPYGHYYNTFIQQD